MNFLVPLTVRDWPSYRFQLKQKTGNWSLWSCTREETSTNFQPHTRNRPAWPSGLLQLLRWGNCPPYIHFKGFSSELRRQWDQPIFREQERQNTSPSPLARRPVDPSALLVVLRLCKDTKGQCIGRKKSHPSAELACADRLSWGLSTTTKVIWKQVPSCDLTLEPSDTKFLLYSLTVWNILLVKVTQVEN